MKKNYENTHDTNPDPYEDSVRLEKLDPYEALIEFNSLYKKDNKSIE